jgi:hypothetical protein
MAFLGERSREKRTVSINDIAKKLGIETDY